ncbi:hypothetical protein ABVK25_002001 [Lepraria finkii]|uniref:Uncharacterized protein n=1 Tax=Lepraria finkii TaxID=1340010 RepID=A0ABR4BJN0_9LECA
MEKLLAYLEMKEREQFHLPACIQPYPAALPSIAEESEGAEQAGEIDATRHELARYGLKELKEDTEPAGYDIYLGYALGTNDTTCAYSTPVSPRFEPFRGFGCTVLDPASLYCRAIKDQHAQLKLDVAIFHNLTQQSAHSSGTTSVKPILALIDHLIPKRSAWNPSSLPFADPATMGVLWCVSNHNPCHTARSIVPQASSVTPQGL